MSKTPYEIRFDLLVTAKDLLEQEYNYKRETAIMIWNEEVEMAKVHENYVVPDFPTLPEFPTNEQIIAKAKELNDFISNG